MVDIEQTLDELKTLDDAYFKDLMEYYPKIFMKEDTPVPNKFCEKAINVQTLLTMLGETAFARMKYIGFDMLYPFDNPIDAFSWKENVKQNKAPQTLYFSISIRMESELKRMHQYMVNDAWDTYCALSESEFLVSKARYLEYFREKEKEQEQHEPQQRIKTTGDPQVYVENLHYDARIEEKAISQLDKLHKESSIWSNIANVATKIIGA